MAIGMNGNGRKPTQTVDRVAYPNQPEHASALRSFVGDFLTRTHVAENIADEILMAVGEVVANACVHGRPGSREGQVDLTCEAERALISVSVTDDGPGFEVAAVLGNHMPDVLSQGGRGFFLMRQLMDRVDVESSAAGTTVTVERDLPR